MKRIMFMIAFLGLFLVAACAPSSVVCPDGSVVASEAECAAPAPEPEPAQEMAAPEPVAPPAQAERPAAPATLAPEVEELLAKSAKVKSIGFLHAPILLQNGIGVVHGESTYLRSGKKVKVKVPAPVQYDKETFADTVYLDLASETAQGFCTNKLVGCGQEGSPRPASFGDYAITWPEEWIARIPGSAQLTGSREFESRNVRILRYKEGGKYYEMLIDQFMGTPLRVGIYTEPDYTGLVGGVEYQDVTFNTVKEADVTPPSG